MKRLTALLPALLLAALPALAQLDSVGLTPSAVTLMTDTTGAVADSLNYVTHPATQSHYVGFDFNVPTPDDMPGLLGTSFLGFIVLPLLVIVAAVVLIVRALRRPVARHAIRSPRAQAWLHAQENSAIRTGSVGVGIALLGAVMGWTFLAGIGLLVAAIGAGNFWIARRDRRFFHPENDNNDNDACDNT